MRTKKQPHSRVALWALLCSLIFAGPALACINEYERPERPSKPRPERPSEFMTHLRDHSDHDRIVSSAAPVEPGPDADFKARSDYAARLVHRGESRKAVDVLEAVERSHPGEYIVAANLGTAYELSGDLAKAHHWIGEGMRRNPDSHEGTEWLHLRILEARMALAKNPDWLRTHSVIGLNFGSDAQPRKPEEWPKDTGGAEGVMKALTYQLRERMAFVPAPDPLVGSLIADLGVLLLLYRNADMAIPVFDLALTYRPFGVAQVEARRSLSEEIVRSRGDSDRNFKLAMIGIASLTIGAALILKWRQGR
ncbi:MAG TPA: hypothetical protein VNM14_07360 [Planctomycetota bacterium]|jgi:hypothetical protein|nr:hypothetical protein [Planctomycetota bacterium]